MVWEKKLFLWINYGFLKSHGLTLSTLTLGPSHILWIIKISTYDGPYQQNQICVSFLTVKQVISHVNDSAGD